MAGDCGLNALSLLPENVLPQWQQKIALRAENPSGRGACWLFGIARPRITRLFPDGFSAQFPLPFGKQNKDIKVR